MSFIFRIALTCFAVALGFAATAQASTQMVSSSSPEETVQSLYRQVQHRAPSGLPVDGDMQIIAPFLSGSLRRKFDLAAACESDWNLKNHGQMIKAPFSWSEFGLFSGANERISPASFHIESVHKDRDASFQITVSFTHRPGDGSGSWHVTDHLIHEDGRFVLDDVLFSKNASGESLTLTGILSEGCERAHWVG